jgi:hypothetical protein
MNFQQNILFSNFLFTKWLNSPPKISPVKPTENWTSKKNLPSAKRRK